MTVNGDDIIRATAVLAYGNGQELNNVFHLKYQSAFSGADADVMTEIAAILDAVYSEIDEGINSTVEFVEVRGFNVTQNSPLPTTTWPSLTVGGGAGDPTPAGVALLVSLNTGVLKVHGRKYLPGVGENSTTAGKWATDILTLAAAWGAALMDAYIGIITAGVYVFGVLDKTGVLREIIEIVTSDEPAYQRRRRLGTGD